METDHFPIHFTLILETNLLVFCMRDWTTLLLQTLILPTPCTAFHLSGRNLPAATVTFQMWVVLQIPFSSRPS